MPNDLQLLSQLEGVKRYHKYCFSLQFRSTIFKSSIIKYKTQIVKYYIILLAIIWCQLIFVIKKALFDRLFNYKTTIFCVCNFFLISLSNIKLNIEYFPTMLSIMKEDIFKLLSFHEAAKTSETSNRCKKIVVSSLCRSMFNSNFVRHHS